jgi:pyrroline-5-carboxylate reductase
MTKVAIIGCGGLGSALARGLSRTDGIELVVCDRHPAKVAEAIEGGEGTAEPDLAVAADGAEVVVLAVKPKDIHGVAQVVDALAEEDALLVSCAAGLPFASISGAASRSALARAMPNTGSGVGAGCTAVVLGPRCEETRDTSRLNVIFGAVGEVVHLAVEDELHGATALAGSGPAFALLALEAMIDAGVAAGVPRAPAETYARGAFRAAAALADGGELDPAGLRARITSPGGTTAAGLAALERGGARAAFADAVAAAYARSREMSG